MLSSAVLFQIKFQMKDFPVFPDFNYVKAAAEAVPWQCHWQLCVSTTAVSASTVGSLEFLQVSEVLQAPSVTEAS